MTILIEDIENESETRLHKHPPITSQNNPEKTKLLQIFKEKKQPSGLTVFLHLSSLVLPWSENLTYIPSVSIDLTMAAFDGLGFEFRARFTYGLLQRVVLHEAIRL